MRGRFLEESVSETNSVQGRLVSHRDPASEHPALLPNQAFQPTSTPPGIWSIGWAGVGVAAAELGCWAAMRRSARVPKGLLPARRPRARYLVEICHLI